MQYLNVNGTQLAYVEQGQGDPVIFVHGSLDDLRSWRQQMRPLGARYRAIAYSRRYHYPNPWTDDGLPYSAALHAEDLACVIAALGPRPAHLVTSSYGGYVALYLAARRPEFIRSLVLGEPPLMPWLHTMPEGAPLAEEFSRAVWEPAQAAFRAGDLEGGAAFFLDGVMGRSTFAYLSPAGRQMMLDNAPEMQAETASHDFFSPFTRAEAATIRRPVLLLNGSLSPRLFYLITDELQRYLPDTTRSLVPGAAHAMHLGNAAVYNARVLEFLEAH